MELPCEKQHNLEGVLGLSWDPGLKLLLFPMSEALLCAGQVHWPNGGGGFQLAVPPRMQEAATQLSESPFT